MTFSYYSETWKTGITLAALLELAKDGTILARAENSGSEGCYIEVARWNEYTQRWERFCFSKVFGGEHPSEKDAPGIPSRATAEKFAAEINSVSNLEISFIHRLPSWTHDWQCEKTNFEIVPNYPKSGENQGLGVLLIGFVGEQWLTIPFENSIQARAYADERGWQVVIAASRWIA